jgi:hypothetical protein
MEARLTKEENEQIVVANDLVNRANNELFLLKNGLTALFNSILTKYELDTKKNYYIDDDRNIIEAKSEEVKTEVKESKKK